MTSSPTKVCVTSLLMILSTQVVSPGAADVAVGGTMVVAVRFKDGLVVCADKRSHLDGPGLPKGNYRDDDVKITLVDPIGGFVTAGVPILQRNDGVRVFDADSVIRDHLSEVGFAKFDQLAQRAEDTAPSVTLFGVAKSYRSSGTHFEPTTRCNEAEFAQRAIRKCSQIIPAQRDLAEFRIRY